MIEFKNNFFALEGLPGVGKTVLTKKLSSLNCKIIKEIPEQYKNSKRKRGFKNTKEKIEYENIWYLKKEFQRVKSIKEKNKYIILDRCIYSQIAHNYAYDKLYKTQGLPFLFKLLDSIEKRDELFIKMIFFKCTPAFSIKRRIQRNTNNEKERILNGEIGWYSEIFLEKLLEGYNKIIKIIPKKYILIINTPKEQHNYIHLVLKFLNKKSNFKLSYEKLKKEFNI